ncbi:MAG: hypothetical protein AAF657_16315 [Acidobacteriota bacterium]
MASLIARKLSPTSRTLFWVGAAALVVRFLYFYDHAGSAFFHVTILDEKFYDSVARAIVAGDDAAALNAGFRPWLYPLVLSALYALGGEWGYVLALIFQHLLGVATAVMVCAVAMRLFGRPLAGAVAGGLYVLAGPPLFFEGELLITSLFTFLGTTLLWILSRAEPLGNGSSWRWIAAGLCLGLAAQARPNVLLFLAAFPTAALLLRSGPSSRRWLHAAAAIFGVLFALLGFAAAQQDLAGRFQLIPGAGGVNFYLGNKTGADGMIPRQDRQITYAEDYRDSVQVFAEELYREEQGRGVAALSPGDVSTYWLGRALEDILADPLGWAGLMGRKIWFLAWNHEIPNNKSYDFTYQQESSLLSYLPVRWWWLLSLAVLGLPPVWRGGDRQLFYWIGAFLILHALGVVLFFVNSRYRIPMWPGMAVLAAGGVLTVIDVVRRRSVSGLVFVGLTLAGVAAISLINWLQIPPQGFARDYYFRALAYMEKDQLDEAFDDALRSVGLDPKEPAPRFHLGNVALALGNDDLAYRHYQVASGLSPPEPRILNNMGIISERRKRPDIAYGYYRRALLTAADYGPALVNVALLELRAGLADRAQPRIERAEALGLESVPLLCARAFLEFENGRPQEARRILQQARTSDPATVDQLIGEMRRRLKPETLQFTP